MAPRVFYCPRLFSYYTATFTLTIVLQTTALPMHSISRILHWSPLDDYYDEYSFRSDTRTKVFAPLESPLYKHGHMPDLFSLIFEDDNKRQCVFARLILNFPPTCLSHPNPLPRTTMLSECPNCGACISVELKTAPKPKQGVLESAESRGRATHQSPADSSLPLPLRTTKPASTPDARESPRRRDRNHSKRKRSPSFSVERATGDLENSPPKKKVISENSLSSSPSPSSTILQNSPDLISRIVAAAEPTFTVSKPLPKGLKFKKDKTGSKASQH